MHRRIEWYREIPFGQLKRTVSNHHNQEKKNIPGSSKWCWMDDKLCLFLPSLRVQRAPQLEDAGNKLKINAATTSTKNSRVCYLFLYEVGWKLPGRSGRKDRMDGRHLPISGIINGTATMRSDLQICIQLFFSPQLMKKRWFSAWCSSQNGNFKKKIYI